MTVSATARKAGPFVGNGVATVFPFDFKVFSKSDLQVLLTDATGLVLTLVLDSDYSVTLNVDQDATPGGSITYPIIGSPLASPATLAAIGSLPYDQATDITNVGRFNPDVVERAFDKVTMLMQQLREVSNRTLQAAVGTVVNLVFPAPSPGKFIRWRGDLTGLENAEGGDSSLVLQGLLADSTLNTRGAGMSGYNAALAYAGGTVGASLKTAAAAAVAAQSTIDTYKTDIASLANVAKGAALMGYKLNATGAVGRLLSDKLLEQVSIKDFGALGDNATDDAAAINAAITFASAAGGGTVLLPRGTYIVGAAVILRDNVTLQGAGLGGTIIKQKAATALTSCVQSLNAYSLFGTSSLSGPAALNIRDLTIDANRQNGASGDGLAIYGPLFSLDNLEVMNASGIGVRTEFGTPGAIGHGFCAQSNMNNCWVHDCNTAGVKWCGPSDPSITNCNIYRNLNYNLWLAGPVGTGCKVLNCHVWGSTFDSRQATTGIRVDTVGNLICNTVAEGSTVHQMHLRAGINYIVGGNLYYNSDATNTYGVVIGDVGAPSNNNTIMTRIDNCRAGAIYFFNTVGLNKIDVQGYNSGAAAWSGYTGAVPTPYNDWINMQIYGDVAGTNGRAIFFPGMGPITTGAVNSGGAGFRQVLAPN